MSPTQKKVTLIYDAGHSYIETFEHDTVLFCPHCGLNGVWIECSEGDYYQGPTFICVECGTSFTMPGFNPRSKNKQDMQRAEQLRGQ